MKSNILVNNEKLRLNLGWLLCICFALPSPINIGMADYFTNFAPPIADSGFLRILADNQNMQFLVGYALAIILVIFFPRCIVWIARIIIIIGLVAVLAMFLPLPHDAMAAAYCLQVLTDVLIITLETAIVISLFSKETAIKAVCLLFILGDLSNLLVLHGIIPVSLTIFKVFVVLASVCWIYFYWSLPAKAWPTYVRKADGLEPPRIFFAGICLLVALGGFFMLFGQTIAQGTPENYTKLSAILSAAAIYALWRFAGINPFRSATILISLGTIGFAGMIVSIYIPAFAVPSCSLIGASAVIIMINQLYGIILMERYPSRFIIPMVMIVAITVVAIHSLLLNALQDNIQFLYAIYLFIGIIFTMLYLVLAPYLSYTLHKKSATGEVQADAERDASSTPSIATTEPDIRESLSGNAFDKLSGQELRLAELIMQGYSHPEIIKILNVTDNTVRAYRKSLYSKLQIHSRRELFELAEK